MDHQHHARSRIGRRDGHHHHAKKNVVTVTASVSGEGSIIGFKTLGVPVASTPESLKEHTTKTTSHKESIKTAEKTSPTKAHESSTRATSSSHSKATTSSHKTASSSERIHTSPSSSASPAVSSSSISATLVSATASSAIASPTSTTSAVVNSKGMSTGAVGGLVGGGVALLLILGAIAIFFYRRKAQQKNQEAYGKPEDEKNLVAKGAVFTEKDTAMPISPVTVTSEKAPRVSLRPVTQFLPNLTGVAPISSNETTSDAQQRTMNGSDTRKAAPPALHLGESNGASNGTSASSPETPTIVVAPPELSPNPSIASGFTEASAAGLPGSKPWPSSPVHRVQMDYKKSMPDELELRAGQLVRIVHEYDDGWVLCVRLDRSQQGVCPRTCLSQRPVKPRPHGPPGSGAPSSPATRGPSGRSGYPMANRPQSPSAGGPPNRPYSPSNGPRPQSPGVQHSRPSSPVSRPQSPGYARPMYRPSTPTQRQPQSPTSSPGSPQSPPQIVVSPYAPPAQSPASPVNQSPTATHRPAIAPIRPSPLSTQTSSSDALPAGEHETEPVFHAM